MCEPIEEETGIPRTIPAASGRRTKHTRGPPLDTPSRCRSYSRRTCVPRTSKAALPISIKSGANDTLTLPRYSLARERRGPIVAPRTRRSGRRARLAMLCDGEALRGRRRSGRGPGDRRRAGGPDGGGGTGRRRPRRAAGRGEADHRAQAADGRQVGPEPDQGHAAGAFAAAYTRGGDWLAPILAEFGPAEVARLGRGPRRRGLHRQLAPGVPARDEGVAAAPRLDTAARRPRRGVRTRWRWEGWSGPAACFTTPEGPRAVVAERDRAALGGGSWARLGSDGAWAAILAAEGVGRAVPPLERRLRRRLVAGDGAALRRAGEGGAAGGRRASLAAEFVVSAHGVEGGGIYALAHLLRDGAPLVLDLGPAAARPTLARAAWRGRAAAPRSPTTCARRRASRRSRSRCCASSRRRPSPIPPPPPARSRRCRSRSPARGRSTRRSRPRGASCATALDADLMLAPARGSSAPARCSTGTRRPAATCSPPASRPAGTPAGGRPPAGRLEWRLALRHANAYLTGERDRRAE